MLLGRALVALVPLSLAVVDPGGLAPFGPVKWALLTGATLALAAVVLRRRITVARRPAQMWMAFLAIVVVAALFGADPLYAWTGTPERHFGALTWLLCALLFVVGQNLDDRTAVDRRSPAPTLLTATAVAGAVIGVWSVAELLGWKPVALAGTAGRVVGPLGSSAYLGAAVVLVGPIAVVRWRWLAPVLVVVLAATGARAAWVGALVAFAVVAATRRRLIRLAAAFALGLVALIFVTGTADRVAKVFTDEDGGGRGRLDEWRVAARVVAAHPLLGVGPEGYRIVFHERVDAAYDKAHGRDPLPDRAHNAILDVATTTGVLGALAYVALLFAAGAIVVAALRRGDATDAAIAVGLLAYGAQLLFLFPLAELDPLAWLLLGVLATRMRPTNGGTGTNRDTIDVNVPSALPMVAAVLT
nr:O-antigen ligase family protein [Actinomycetota bacterium]